MKKKKMVGEVEVVGSPKIVKTIDGGKEELFCVRSKDGTLLATMNDKETALKVRTTLFRRENRMSNVARFRPKNSVEEALGKEFFVKSCVCSSYNGGANGNNKRERE